MPDPVIVICGFVIFIVSAVFILAGGLEGYWDMFSLGIIGILLDVILGFWLLVALQYPVEVLESKTFAIETVKLEDGTSSQMISISPTEKIDITKEFRRIFPEGTQIKRNRQSCWSCGIYFVDRSEWQNTVILPERK